MAKLCIIGAAIVCVVTLAQAERMFGGPIEASVREKGVKQALAFAMYNYNMGNNDMYVSRVNNVQGVKKQMVSGIKYSIDVEVVRTDCRKPTTDVNNCTLPKDPALSKPTLCHFEVLRVPWKNSAEMIKAKCDYVSD